MIPIAHLVNHVPLSEYLLAPDVPNNAAISAATIGSDVNAIFTGAVANPAEKRVHFGQGGIENLTIQVITEEIGTAFALEEYDRSPIQVDPKSRDEGKVRFEDDPVTAIWKADDFDRTAVVTPAMIKLEKMRWAEEQERSRREAEKAAAQEKMGEEDEEEYPVGLTPRRTGTRSELVVHSETTSDEKNQTNEYTAAVVGPIDCASAIGDDQQAMALGMGRPGTPMLGSSSPLGDDHDSIETPGPSTSSTLRAVVGDDFGRF